MTIRGLTDNVTPRFPSLGRLRKGGAKQEKNGREIYGKDLTFFRFTSERPEIVKAFVDTYGPEPASLHVYLPYAKLDDNFATWKEQWSAGGLQHRCDGENCMIWLGPDKKYHREPKECPGGCDEVGRLTVILPELLRAGFVGYVTLETHSIHDMLNITASLLAVTEARAGNDLGLRGVEFVLRRKPETISTPGWGANADKRQRVEKWLVSIEPLPTWAETQLQLTAPQPALPGATIATTSGFVDEATGEILQAPDEEPEPEEGDFEQLEPAPASVAGGDRELLTITQAALITAALKDYPPVTDAAKLKRNAVAYLDKLFGGNEDERHAFIKWAFDVSSMNDLNDAQRHTIIDFVKLSKMGDDWLPSTKAMEFLHAWRRTHVQQQPLIV